MQGSYRLGTATAVPHSFRLSTKTCCPKRRVLREKPVQSNVRRVKSWSEFYSNRTSLSDAIMQVASHVRLLELIPGGSRVLEVGAGSGSLSGFLSGHARVTIIEPDLHVGRNALANPLMDGPRVELLQGDGMRLPFRADAFDVVYSQGLFEHFGDADVRRFVTEGLRVAPLVLASIPSVWYPHLGRVLRPTLRGDERLLNKDAWMTIVASDGAQCQATYYPDVKLGTIAGRTFPWPTHILLRVRRSG